MGKLFDTKQRGTLSEAVSVINTHLKNQNVGVFSESLATKVASLESLSEEDLNGLRDVAKQATPALESMFDQLGISENQNAAHGYLETRRSEASRDAASIVMMAQGNPAHYMEKALSVAVEQFSDASHGRVVNVVGEGANGNMQYNDSAKFGLESYDENELKKHIAFSTVFAAATARQADFAEAFFPTYVVSPEQIGTDVRVRRNMVLNRKLHPITGKPMDLEKVNLLDAFRDHKILSNESTLLVPVYRDESKEFFVDTTKVQVRTVPVDGVDVDTAPLQFGKTIDLLGISQNDQLLKAGIVDNTDAVDAYARLDNLFVQVGDQIVSFNVRRSPRAGAVKSVEGDSREMNFQFQTYDLLLDADTKDVDGKEVTALSTLNGMKLRFAIRVSGELNVEYGNINLVATGLAVSAVFDAQNEAVSLNDAAAKAIIDALKLEAFGYELLARRNNANRRSQGLLVDVTEYAERYTVPISSPLSTVAPLATDKSAKDLQALINAANIRTNNNAVTLLLNYADDLKVATQTSFFKSSLTTVPGIGRLLVEPTFKYLKIDLAKEVNSVQSAQRAEDIQGALVTPIRNMAYELVRDSNYQAALDADSEGRTERPHLVVGTDIVTQQFLMVTGDDRTLSIGMDHTIVASPDKRMVGKIVLAFVRKNTSEPDALSFGSHIYIPELSSVVPVNRFGATNRETMIQMRNLQITNLPVMGMIEVENLDVATATRTALDVNSKAVKGDGTPVDPVKPGEDGDGDGENGGTDQP
jgi:hypothetical protein